MKLAIVGATGLVGQEMLQVIDERKFKFDELILVASDKSLGKKIIFQNKEYTLQSAEKAISQKPDIALFSAGGKTSLELAPLFAEAGTIVIDNSSAWRMHPKHKLIVPEINAHLLRIDDRIIANPNCSTIQMVLALAPLHKIYKIKRIVVSTYQSVSGSGKYGVDQLQDERKGIEGIKKYPYPIDMNAIPHIDVFLENEYTKEEMKMIEETQKILGDNSIRVTATTVRIPVMGGHSESVNVEFENEYNLQEVINILKNTQGIIVENNSKELKYPMPLYTRGKDDVFVGRIRRDESQPNSLNLWIVADPLRKGAATNAVQIAEYITQHFL